MFTVKMDAAELATAVAWISKGAARKAHVPALRSAHVSATVDGLRLRATDYDLFWQSEVPAEGGAGADTAVLVDPAALAKLLKGSKGDALVTVSDTGLEVVIGARTVRVGAAAELGDYPQWPEFIPNNFGAPAVVDPAAIKRALVAAGKDATLPMLTGVKFDDGQMVTTDRFRLARVDHAGAPFEALVPAATLRPFTVGKGDVSVEHGQAGADKDALGARFYDRLRVSRGGRSIVARVLDCEFPKWRHLIESAKNGAAMVAEVRKADLLASLAGLSVDLEWQAGGTVTVTGRSAFADDPIVSVQTIAADIATDDGLPITVRLSTEYLTAALKAFDGDMVTFSMSLPHRPVSLESGADYHLLMPQRVPA